ncbi:MAG: D-alanine--D-alanine ligase family protein [Bacillota bacterium]
MEEKVAVVQGGRSEEREISLKTGQAVYQTLKNEGVDVVTLDSAQNDFEARLDAAEIDVAFIALHGRYGEDGTIQGLFEMKGIPYTGSGVLASSVAMNKVVSKKLFQQEGVSTPEFKVLNKREYQQQGSSVVEKLKAEIDLPVVIKPALEGSSLGLSIVQKDEDLVSAIEQALEYDTEILVEEFITGCEITVGILGNQELTVLPIIEIKPKTGVYDFEAKYTKGLTEFIVPAKLKTEIYQQSQLLARQAYEVLNCAGFARVDLMLSSTGQPYVLEINTIPGLTETSLLPQAAQAADIDFSELVIKILEYALE